MKKVFAHYFTWFASKEISGQWCHWNWDGVIPHNPENFIRDRKDIASVYYPELGVYDSSDESILRRHVDMALNSGIDFFTVDWYGDSDYRKSYRDKITDNNFGKLIKLSAEKDFSVNICFEEKILFDEYIKSDKERIIEGKKHFQKIKKYFDTKGYYCHNNQPLLIIWGSHNILPEVLNDILDEIRDYNPIILYSYYDEKYIETVDGFFPWVYIDTKKNIEKNIARDYEILKNAYDNKKIDYYAASVWPDFNDWGVQAWDSEPHRKCPDAEGLYELTWKLAIESEAEFVSIATFNDWNEGSNIEPSIEKGTEYLNITKKFSQIFKEESYLKTVKG